MVINKQRHASTPDSPASPPPSLARRRANTTANTPCELFFDQLRDIYSMEVQLHDSMIDLVSLCSNDNLRDLIVCHSLQNHTQIAEISAIFERHGESPGNVECKAMAGLIEGGTAHLEAVRSPQTRDLMMVAHCIRIEYYEIAAYEFTTLLCARLGLLREPVILSGLLAEEKEMAATLMRLEPELFKAASTYPGNRDFDTTRPSQSSQSGFTPW